MSNVRPHVNTPQFTELPFLWEPDGSLRDVYVLRTSLADWEVFLAFVSSYPYTHAVDGERCPMPSAAHIFGSPSSSSHLLRVSLGQVTVNCHFFTESELELDIEPREVRGAEEHAQVMRFVEQLAMAIGKPALITPEGGATVPFLSFDPLHGVWSSAESPAS